MLTLLGAEGWMTEVTSNTNNSVTALKTYMKPTHVVTTFSPGSPEPYLLQFPLKSGRFNFFSLS